MYLSLCTVFGGKGSVGSDVKIGEASNRSDEAVKRRQEGREMWRK